MKWLKDLLTVLRMRRSPGSVIDRGDVKTVEPADGTAVSEQTAAAGVGSRVEPGPDLPALAMTELIETAKYFRSSMETRRSIELRAFLVTTGFDLLLLKAFLDYHDDLDQPLFKGLAQLAMIAGTLVYGVMLIQIERVSGRSRTAYRTAESRISERLGVASGRPQAHKESRFQTVVASWAATWPWAAAMGVAVGSAIALYFVH
jgi:hypothetical protein